VARSCRCRFRSHPSKPSIAARLREQLAEIDRAKAALEAQRRTIDALPAALLREAFGPAGSLDG
jgi:hypothetical protein